MPDRRLIHIVDDEEAIRRSAGFMLKTSGFDVQTWPSGVAFLKEARQLNLELNPFDGDRAAQIVNDTINSPPELIAKAKAVLDTPK